MTKLQDFLNSPLSAVSGMARGARAGDLFGVELECEGKNVDYRGRDEDNDVLKDWAPHADGSLRDHHGAACEWVFNGPVTYDQSVKRIHTLFDMFERNKAKLVTSNRTSTHVHFNMGDKNAYQVVNMFILFTILEDILDRFCGEDRNGNLFCLSSRHAEQQLNWVMDAVFKHGTFGIIRGDNRYCSMNLASLNKFGTVEFRGMRGLDNRDDLLQWLSILNEFCEYACYKMKNPVDILQMISQETPLGFIKRIFSKPNFLALTKGIDENEVNHSVYEGLRLVQMLCYKVGTEFEQVRLRGRDFWASFGGGAEPQLDVDPHIIKENGVIGGRGRAPRAVPFGGLGAGNELRFAAPGFPKKARVQVDPEADIAAAAQWFINGQENAAVPDAPKAIRDRHEWVDAAWPPQPVEPPVEPAAVVLARVREADAVAKAQRRALQAWRKRVQDIEAVIPEEDEGVQF